MTELYHYNKEGLFTNQTTARMNPLDSDLSLVPTNSTLLIPPSVAAYQIALFEENQWSVVSDYRGFKYWLPESGLIEIDKVNVEPQANAILYNESDMLIEEYNIWRLETEEDKLNNNKKQKISLLDSESNNAINSGFNSKSLGNVHHYDSDQKNMRWIQSCIIVGEDSPINCDDIKGNEDSKQLREHTPDQTMTVLKDSMITLSDYEKKFRDLRDQVLDADDLDQVDNINW